MSKVLKLISGNNHLVLDACDGTGTIFMATKIFSDIDPDFGILGINLLNGKATPHKSVAVYELTKGANFFTMFTSLSSNANNLVLEQDQILSFITKYRIWLRQKMLATFFLFPMDDELFVARVNIVNKNQLTADLYEFEHDFVWSANCRHRLVVPKR